MIDLNLLLHLLLGLTHIQAKLAKEFDWQGPFFAKIAISGVWRTIPFFDTEHIVTQYETQGIALTLREKLTIFPGDSQSSYLELFGREGAADDESFRVMIVNGGVKTGHAAAQKSATLARA